MAGVSTYLNFTDSTESAFAFYKTVFGTESSTPIMRFKDMPSPPGAPPVPPEVANLVMHMELPILGGHILHGTDAPEAFGFKVLQGNNLYINLEPDTRTEADSIFSGLSEGGQVEQPLQEQFWGAYFGSFKDKFGVQWMINCTAKN
jgi:PhnB protein